MTGLTLRSPKQVMRLSRMGAFFPTRISFMRTLMRQLAKEAAQVSRPVWDIDAKGFGRAVYSVSLGGFTYSLVAFSNDLAPESRTDRVIAEAWDAAFVLFDGVPSAEDVDRLALNTPRQEAGRFNETELVLSRANKSVRFFQHVVDRLASGQQPEAELTAATGYLMRTTAVYGNGKFGCADRNRITDRPYMSAPFHAEMLSVWLIRTFSQDLVQHVAKVKNPSNFVPLSPVYSRALGVGNATGLGMAPFLVNHPILLNNWMLARETALARVRAIKTCSPNDIQTILGLLGRAQAHVYQWNVQDTFQMERIETLRSELSEIATTVDTEWLSIDLPYARLVDVAQNYSEECQELIVALVLEPNGALIDDLGDEMATVEELYLAPAMTIGELDQLIKENYGWALNIDFDPALATQAFWYTSASKMEPRIGNRHTEEGAEREMPLDIGRRLQELRGDLKQQDPKMMVARFLARHPEHRHIVRRIQNVGTYPYSEIQDNLLDVTCRPIDMLRCKLSFFGAAKFDPKSDLWTRINMFQGAPTFSDLTPQTADDWWLPVLDLNS